MEDVYQDRGRANTGSLYQIHHHTAQTGIQPSTLNTQISAFNSFLSWLADNGYGNRWHVKLLREEKKIQPGFGERELKKIIHYKPTCWSMHRLHVMILLMIDCGLRIRECFYITRDDVDMD